MGVQTCTRLTTASESINITFPVVVLPSERAGFNPILLISSTCYLHRTTFQCTHSCKKTQDFCDTLKAATAMRIIQVVFCCFLGFFYNGYIQFSFCHTETRGKRNVRSINLSCNKS